MLDRIDAKNRIGHKFAGEPNFFDASGPDLCFSNRLNREAAQKLAARNPENTIFYAERPIGRKLAC